MTIRIFLLGIFLCSFTANAENIKCNPNGNQAEMNQCAWQDYQIADQNLNETWKKLMAKFKNDKIATTKLKTAQKAWIVFRDAELEAQFACNPKDEPCWGSIEPLLRNGVLTDMTQQRTERLQKYIDHGLGVSME